MLRALLWLSLLLASMAPGITVLYANETLGRFITLACLFAAAVPVMKAAELLLSPSAQRREKSISRAPALLAIAFISIQIISLVRGFLVEHSIVNAASYRMLVYVTMISLVAISWHVIAARSQGATSLFSAVLTCLSLYCLINLLLYAIGVRNPNSDVGTSSEQSYLLSLFGFTQNRVLFPLAWGVNNFSTIAGAVLAAGLCRYVKSNSGRARTLIVFVGVPFMCCLLSDSRAAIAFSVAAAGLALMAPRLGRSGILLFWLLGSIVLLGSQVAQDLTFAGREGRGTFTGREVIWAAGVAELSQFKAQHLWGYGNFGQLSSGVSGLYEMLFKSYSANPELISVHNTYLQAILDTGYLGLLVLILFLQTSIKTLGRLATTSLSWEPTAAMALLIFWATNGLTEITLSFYQPWAALVIFSIASYLLRVTKQPTYAVSNYP